MSGLHLYDKGKEHLIILDASCGDIRRTSYDVMAVRNSAYGGVQCGAAVA